MRAVNDSYNPNPKMGCDGNTKTRYVDNLGGESEADRIVHDIVHSLENI